jgi:hypothetical protein
MQVRNSGTGIRHSEIGKDTGQKLWNRIKVRHSGTGYR